MLADPETIHVGEEAVHDYLNRQVRDQFQYDLDVVRHTTRKLNIEYGGAIESVTYHPNEDVANVSGLGGGKWSYFSGGVDHGTSIGTMYTTIDDAGDPDLSDYVVAQPSDLGGIYYFRMNSSGFPSGQFIVSMALRVSTFTYFEGAVIVGIRRHSDSATWTWPTLKFKAGLLTQTLTFPANNPFTSTPWTSADIAAFDSTFEFYLDDVNLSGVNQAVVKVSWDISYHGATTTIIPGDPWPVTWSTTSNDYVPLGGTYLGLPWFYVQHEKRQADTMLICRAIWSSALDAEGIFQPAIAVNDVMYDGLKMAQNDGGVVRTWDQTWQLLYTPAKPPFPGIAFPTGVYRMDLYVRIDPALFATMRTPFGYCQMDVFEVTPN